jgi:hypothetical protein
VSDDGRHPPRDEAAWRRGLLHWSHATLFWSLIGVILTGLVVAIFVATIAVPWLRVELTVRPFDEALALLRLIFGSLAFTFFGLGALLTRYAWRIWRHAEAPPPDAFVIFDTPVIRGALARQRAAVVGFAACLLLAGSVGLSLFPNAIEQAVGPPPTDRSVR